MPDKYTSQNITSVAQMLGEYLDVAMKRQDQFKSPLVRVQRADGTWGLERAYAGMAITQPKEEPDYGTELLDLIDYAKLQNPDAEESPYLKTKEVSIQALIDSGTEITKDIYDAEYKNISGTFGLDKQTFFNIEVTDPFTGITTKRRVSGEKLKEGIVTKQKEPTKVNIKTLQTENIKYEDKVAKLKADAGGEVGYDEPKKAVTKKGWFGTDWLAKDIPAEEGGYWEMINGEKIPLENKREYDERVRAQAKADKYVPIFEKWIRENNAKMGVPQEVEPEIAPEVTPTEEEIKEEERERLKKFITK